MVRDAVHDGHCFGLSAARQQEFGGLVEVEQEETAEEHDECQGAQAQHQVAPPPVVGFGARRGGGGTREVGDESPG